VTSWRQLQARCSDPKEPPSKSGCPSSWTIEELRKLRSDLKGMTEELKLELGDCDEHIRLGQKVFFPGEPKGIETKGVKSKLS